MIKPHLIRYAFVRPAWSVPHDLAATEKLIDRCALMWSQAIGREIVDIIRAEHSFDADWLLGFAEHPGFPTFNGRCEVAGPIKRITFDPRSRWEITRWQRWLGRNNGQSFIATCLHEMGHALGLRHGQGDNMAEIPVNEQVTFFSAEAARSLYTPSFPQ